MAKRKSWREKLNADEKLPEIVVCDETKKSAARWGLKPGDSFVIAKPIEVDEIMRSVPPGRLITINEIRSVLAARYGTTTACPITTGIFAWIAAHAAEEDLREGRRDITPYWRTLKADGEVNPKYPGGVETQKKLLEAEGHQLCRKGQKWIVENYRKNLIELT